MKGSIYIDTLSFAFLRAQFEILRKGSKIDDYPLYAGNWKANRYTVNYRKLEDKWYFSNALRRAFIATAASAATRSPSQKSKPALKPVPLSDRLKRGDEFRKITGEHDEFLEQLQHHSLSASLKQTVVQIKSNQEKGVEGIA